MLRRQLIRPDNAFLFEKERFFKDVDGHFFARRAALYAHDPFCFFFGSAFSNRP